jgi:tRNA U38,U39,U40 pseudouridine synthase TruA
MVKHQLLYDEDILIVTPEAPLETNDFKLLDKEINPRIEASGKLKGLLLDVNPFPGWENFSAFLSHAQFIKNHHKKIRKIALVTDSDILSFLPQIAKHFVQTEIRHFNSAQSQMALDWLKESI